MSKDKYPSIFSRQMEVTGFIFLHQMEAIVYTDVTCLKQSRTSENI